jgi:WD40 repeat protein
LEGHADRLTSLSFHPGGKLLASGSADRTVKLWNAGTWKERMTLSGHRAPVQAVAFSPNGKLLASASADGEVRVWDPESGKELARLGSLQKPLSAMAFTGDGKSIAISVNFRSPHGPWQQGQIQLWNIEQLEEAAAREVPR